MKTNYRELSAQEMREINGGRCLLKVIVKITIICTPKKSPCKSKP